jgi:hypothetical protein
MAGKHDSSDEILNWRLAQDAAREHDQRACGDRQDRADRGKRRRSPPAPMRTEPPMADCIAFPLGRRCDLVAKIAERMLAREDLDGEAHLIAELQRQARVLERKGVRSRSVERELRGLAAAVRTELWRRLLGSPKSGGAA